MVTNLFEFLQVDPVILDLVVESLDQIPDFVAR